EVLDLFLEVQEAREHEIDAGGLVLDDALRDLLRRADEARAEAVVVLHEVFERRVGPVALCLGRGFARLLDRIAEPVDRLRVGVLDDVGEHGFGFGLGVAGDDEGVQANPRSAPAVLGRLAADVVELALDAFYGVAVGEVPVRYARRHVPRAARGAALEDLRVGPLDRLELHGEVPDTVEVAGEREVVLRPDAAQDADELFGAAVTLVVLEPRLTERGELALEPPADDVHREAAVRQVIGGGPQLGQDPRVPEAGVHRGDHLEALGRQEQRQAEGGRLVLQLGAVARHVANLAERVLEAAVLGQHRQLAVILVGPVGALLDLADDQASAHVGHPVGELDRVGDGALRIAAHRRLLGVNRVHSRLTPRRPRTARGAAPRGSCRSTRERCWSKAPWRWRTARRGTRARAARACTRSPRSHRGRAGSPCSPPRRRAP